MRIHPLAGKPADSSVLIDPKKLQAAYFSEAPDPDIQEQLVQFGTSGHRGSSFHRSFNEAHILAITQAICEYRKQQNISGPLFLGIDTHALSEPAFESAMEVLAANGVDVMLSKTSKYTPTPVVSHAILVHNREKKTHLADGIVITPSHNPPQEGGFKYDPPTGGPADVATTQWIEARANELLRSQLAEVKRLPFAKAMRAATTHHHDYLNAYVGDLENVIDFSAIQKAGLTLGVDPLGGAGIDYWQPIAKRYRLNLTVVNDVVDPSFSFMTVDWDGKIRMDPSSPYAMHRLLGLKDRFDIAFACDTDHDRHGIVTKSVGLMPPNHYLSAMIFYLFQHRPEWKREAGIGKTLVSSRMIDAVANKLKRRLYEVPVGFKWFVDGLLTGELGFGGEESAGAAFLRFDGSVWTTDKDGIVPALLSAEITAKMGKDPGELYRDLTGEFGESFYDRIDAKATAEQKAILKKLSSEQIASKTLAGEKILSILTMAPGNGAPIGGVKVMTEHGWFAARPSGTEEIYKIYAESFLSKDHLQQILNEAEGIINKALQGIK